VSHTCSACESIPSLILVFICQKSNFSTFFSHLFNALIHQSSSKPSLLCSVFAFGVSFSLYLLIPYPSFTIHQNNHLTLSLFIHSFIHDFRRWLLSFNSGSVRHNTRFWRQNGG
jgi:hypothetical protein